MRQFLVDPQNYAAALIEAAKRNLQGMPKFYNQGLERLVRTRLEDVTERLNEAFQTARQEHATPKLPSLAPSFGQVDLNIKLIGEPVNGIIEISYRGPQAKSYLDVVHRGLNGVCAVSMSTSTGGRAANTRASPRRCSCPFRSPTADCLGTIAPFTSAAVGSMVKGAIVL